ncbi:Alpha-1,3-mannosyl-glycoprotein 4-beta-N-acetylglucosaminyltransferase B [Myotis davidii]|uniref:Alpha-1,3-mannosyl-glycoprotein 4-beta-N-acetylglucosaminyltransferase B n=1 Tax=Myotis davidii TaxID=225400 RepID=L5M678_MYODS|nr:Alpha-1,3-mannosyl-glycoprotein 4-beta-N-acetylglucosaminyltransferase B [Myotis davidii]
MLHSLISELSLQKDSVIVVLIAETDPQYTFVVMENIKAVFPTEIHSGLLEVIAPSPHFYPGFSRLRESFEDPKERGIYYVQLEDDIVAKPNYPSTMKNFSLQQPSEDWMNLEFTQLGFIGKMFKSLGLSLIVEFILMFYPDKTINWGNIEHLEDKLFNTSLEVLPFDNPQSDKEALQKGCSTTLQSSCDGYLRIGSYKGVAEGEMDPAFGPLEALRPSIHTDLSVWVILSEIFLKEAD